MFTSPLQSTGPLPTMCQPLGENENWNKSQAAVQVYRPSQGKSKHLVGPIHTQLHPSKEMVIVSVDGQDTKKSFRPHGNGMPSPTEQGEEIVLLGYGRSRVGKRKTKVAPASVIERY